MTSNTLATLQRNEHTFLSLAETREDRRQKAPYFKTYSFSGQFLNKEHEALGDHLLPSGMIDYGVEGWLLPADAWKLYEMAFHCQTNILELGTYRGLSSAVMCAALATSGSPGHIVSVDLDPRSPTTSKENLQGRPGASKALFFVVEGTRAIVDQAKAKELFDFAFIDHSHEYEHVFQSCKQLHRVISIGGFALFHDFNDPRNSSKKALNYGVYQGVMDGLDPRLWEFWGIFGCSGLFRRVGNW